MLKLQEKLKMKIAILLAMSLLTSCSATGCGEFHGIRDLTEAQKISLKKSEVPAGWIQDITDFRETYKKLCQ